MATTKTARFTTNIDASLLAYLDERAKAEQSSRRAILEASIRRAEIERIGKLLYESGNELAASGEMQEWLDIANDPVNLIVHD